MPDDSRCRSNHNSIGIVNTHLMYSSVIIGIGCCPYLHLCRHGITRADPVLALLEFTIIWRARDLSQLTVTW